MDVPFLHLTREGNTETRRNQLNSTVDDVQLTVSSDHHTRDTYGKETYDLLERVYLQIKYGKKENINEHNKTEQYLNQAQRYTGLHKDVLCHIWKNPIKIDDIKEIDRIVIYNELMRFYMSKNLMPTTTDLFNNLQQYLPPYLDIKSFRNKLVKMGYLFKKTGKDRAVVVENPAVKFERYMYLKNISRYRKEKRPIYFICEGALTIDTVLNVDECERKHLNQWQQRFISFVSSEEMKCFKYINDSSCFEKWIVNTAFELNNSSVIVLDNSKHYCEKFCETPNLNSLKCDMIEWLEYHHIPHASTMNRLELWTLIEIYTDRNTNLYKVDNWVKQKGIEVLRLPDCINNLTPAAYVRDIIQQNLKREITPVKTMSRLVEDIVKAIGENELNVFDTSLIAEETGLLDLEIKLENIIDNLTPSTNPEIDTYLPSLSDSE